MPQIRSIVLAEGEYNEKGLNLITAAITRLNEQGYRFSDWHNPPGFIILEYTDAPPLEIESKETQIGCWLCKPSDDDEYGDTATPITDEQDASMPDAVLSSNS